MGYLLLLVTSLLVFSVDRTTAQESGIEVRLVEGNTSREGRVEVWHNGEWGTVCRRGFGYKEASVFCRQAGLGASGSVINNTQTPGGEGRIWLADVSCCGAAESITECSHAGWGVTYCTHSSDVAIHCSDAPASPPWVFPTNSPPAEESGIQVRLVEGSTSREGRVEVWYNGEWGTVCRHGFGHTEAAVFCFLAGFGDYGLFINNTQTPGGEGRIWLADVKCLGIERSIAECCHAAWGATYCTHSSDVAIRCKTMGLAANLVVTALALITSVINWL